MLCQPCTPAQAQRVGHSQKYQAKTASKARAACAISYSSNSKNCLQPHRRPQAIDAANGVTLPAPLPSTLLAACGEYRLTHHDHVPALWRLAPPTRKHPWLAQRIPWRLPRTAHPAGHGPAGRMQHHTAATLAFRQKSAAAQAAASRGRARPPGAAPGSAACYSTLTSPACRTARSAGQRAGQRRRRRPFSRSGGALPHTGPGSAALCLHHQR